MMRVVNLRAVVLFLFGIFAMALCPGQAWFGAHSTANAQDNPFGAPTETTAQDDPFGGSTETDTQDDPFGAPNQTAAQVSPANNSRGTVIQCQFDEPSLSTATSVDDVIREKLLATCNFDYDEVSYYEIEEELEQKLGVNIILTESARDDSLTEDETFSSNLSGITHASALRNLLAPKNATYVIDGGVIKIISLDEANDIKWCARRMIDVSETLALIRVGERDRIGKPMPGSPRTDHRGKQNGGGGVFNTQKSKTGTATNPNDMKQLADAIMVAIKDSQPRIEVTPTLVTGESILLEAITKSVFEEMWSPSNEYVNISCVGEVLIVTTTEEIGDRVESFVEDLTFVMKAAAAKKR